jgi:hypothetical protein
MLSEWAPPSDQLFIQTSPKRWLPLPLVLCHQSLQVLTTYSISLVVTSILQCLHHSSTLARYSDEPHGLQLAWKQQFFPTLLSFPLDKSRPVRHEHGHMRLPARDPVSDEGKSKKSFSGVPASHGSSPNLAKEKKSAKASLLLPKRLPYSSSATYAIARCFKPSRTLFKQVPETTGISCSNFEVKMTRRSGHSFRYLYLSESIFPILENLTGLYLSVCVVLELGIS